MFIFRWAREISRTPAELLATTTSAEITEMMAYERLEPFGPMALQHAAGQIAAVVANVNRNPEEHPEPFRAADFMPALRRAMDGYPDVLQPEPMPLTPDQLSAKLDAVMFGRAPQ